ncbi:MAG: hypothetical protein VCF24_18780, partial [Candidatus Latescibacterota bacterium]
GQTYADLRAAHTPWWAAFWSRTFVYLTSDDGVPDFMERERPRMALSTAVWRLWIPVTRGPQADTHANEERYGAAIEALDKAGKTSSAEALAAARWKRT